MVLIGCICRSRGQKIGLKSAIFKNLVWNYKAQSFQNWYTCIASSRSSLPIFGYNNVMASPWPLTFSSGERPRALWALLLKLKMKHFWTYWVFILQGVTKRTLFFMLLKNSASTCYYFVHPWLLSMWFLVWNITLKCRWH